MCLLSAQQRAVPALLLSSSGSNQQLLLVLAGLAILITILLFSLSLDSHVILAVFLWRTVRVR